jgi:peptidoglycan/xylan/chitin deacetylase (PgdA/CDA1 family)
MLRNLAAHLIRPLPLTALERLIPRDPIGFCYHAVCDRQLPHTRHLSTFKSPEQFECDLEFLAENYTLVSYGDLHKGQPFVQGRRPAAVVTFDDGLCECYNVVAPLLAKHGIPAIFFVTTDFLDNLRLCYKHKVSLCIDEYGRRSRVDQASARKELADILNAPIRRTSDLISSLHQMEARAESDLDTFCAHLGIDPDAFLRTARPYLSSAEVLSLVADGFTIGAHSRSHVLLASMTPSEAEADIVESCAWIAKLVGSASVPYAFPFSGRGMSRALLRYIREHHHHVGLFFDTQGIAKDSSDVINRISVDEPRSNRVVDLSLAVRRAYATEMKRVLVGPRTQETRGGTV